MSFGQDNCSLRASDRFGSTPLFDYGGGIAFTVPRFEVDADGAPDSYRVDGKGLSYTCDGITALDAKGRRINKKTDPVHWQERCRAAWAHATTTKDYSHIAIFGFLTDRTTGQPLVQKDGDPLPGVAYLTTTSVSIPGVSGNVQRKWLDANLIPYIVLPVNFVSRYRVKPGAIALVYRPKTDVLTFAVYGDGGDLGEGSVNLHQALKNDPIVVSDGVRRAKQKIPDKIVVVLFPSQAPRISAHAAAWNRAIEDEGNRLLTRLGGGATVKECLKK
ncbi:glycoside hydrolase family 75 protein [Paraburkholderia sp. BL17N1]|uniref:glycoside hydrolase family 75 protein n=1 Tax=Paraburkholderia sp. BL17N1 TaxID=1938798 RepID=UPI0013159E57|nr:glycoside hydrolase family 75 protein [Paraburkholderia sp. BL17N1]